MNEKQNGKILSILKYENSFILQISVVSTPLLNIEIILEGPPAMFGLVFRLMKPGK